VFSVSQEYNIDKANSPVALPAGNWSFRVGNHPILEPSPVKEGKYYGDTLVQQGLGRLINPVQVNYSASGTDFESTAIDGILNAQGCALPVEFTQGVIKVIGMGIELINTTAEIEKQGLISYARMGQPGSDTFFADVALPALGAGSFGRSTFVPIRVLPKNLAELVLYPGFAQDEAKNGYYGPVVLKPNDNTCFPIPVGICVFENDPTGGKINVATPDSVYTSTMNLFTPVTVPPTTVVFSHINTAPIHSPADSNCIMVTGLGDKTTFTLRVRWICERFPSSSEKQILVIANSTANYDPVALEIYSKLVGLIPAGVSFSENPGGEWWARMLGTLGSIVGPMVSMIPHPIAKLAGAGMVGGSSALTNYADSQQARRKVKNTTGKYGEGKKKNKAGDIVPRKARKAKGNGNGTISAIQGPRDPNRS
jgi:hypothetical protein